jgi:hypothetical protein
MIGLWWLSHIQDVLAAASDEQLRAIHEFSTRESLKRMGMTKSGIKCRIKRATERVVKQMVLGRLNSGSKEERASTEDLSK